MATRNSTGASRAVSQAPSHHAVAARKYDPHARISVAVHAAIQLDGIFTSLIAEGRALAASDMVRESSTILALVLRGKELASATIAVLDDELESVERCERIVDGSEPAPANSHDERVSP